MTKLMPCPFCGGKAVIRNNAFRVLVHARVDVYCKRCGVRTMEYKGIDWDDTHRMAIEAWNRRYTAEEIEFDYEAED